MKFIWCWTQYFMLHARHLDGVIFALRQPLIICTCPSIALCFWQAVSAVSGMSAPSLLILSMPLGDRERKVAEDSMENQTSQAFITTKTLLFLHHFCVGVFVVQLSEFHLVFKSYLLHYSVCLLPTTFFSIESISICIKPPKHSCRLA